MVRARIQTSTNHEPFETFFHGWLTRQENYLQELLQLSEAEQQDDLRIKELISQVMAHYNQYYEAKSRIAHENVFVMFSPPWFSSLERSLLWVGGFKPGLAFRIVKNSMLALTEDQERRMMVLAEETRAEEKEMEEELTAVQESVAAQPMLGLAMGQAGTGGEVKAAMEKLRSVIEDLVGCTDVLRGRTVVKVAEILTNVGNNNADN